MQIGLALGTFDGVHKGHCKVIETLKEQCAKKNLLPCAYTFYNVPAEHLSNITNIRIMNPEEKQQTLGEFGLHKIFISEFDDAFASISPHDFVKSLGELGAKLLVVGESFTFGQGGHCTPAELSAIATTHGMDVVICETVYNISSSKIRELIKGGDILNANALMKNPYSVLETVVHGRHLGTQLGYPTANQVCEKYKLLPKNGVYATRVTIDGQTYRCITNVGAQPTVPKGEITVETHIIDFHGDLYGKTLKVEFLYNIRPEKKFSGVDTLVEQIKKDIALVDLT